MIINLNNGIAVQGYDPVSFFDGKAKKGKENITSQFEGAIYLFSSEMNKSRFDANPNSFTPQYGGYCSIAMSEGAKVNPNPKSFLIQGGKLYLFTMMFWGIINVKRQWLKDPVGKQKLADMEWEKMMLIEV